MLAFFFHTGKWAATISLFALAWLLLHRHYTTNSGDVERCYRCAPAAITEQVQAELAELSPGHHQCRACGAIVQKYRPEPIHVYPDGTEHKRRRWR